MKKTVTKNKEILDRLKETFPKLHKLTYIELGILLEKLGFDPDWVSLGEAHDYLGGYKNEERDNITKSVLDIDIFHPTKAQAEAIANNDLRILHLAQGKSLASQKPI